VILVRRETVPDDIHGMWVAQGVLTATGGMTSHAAVVGRQMGKPSVVGAGELAIDEHARTVTVKDHVVKEGDFISFDGLTGEVKVAKVASQPSEILQVLSGTLKPKNSPIYERFSQLLWLVRQVPPARCPRQRGPAGSGGDRLCVRCTRHRALPHRAHVLRRRAHSDRAADDPRRDRGRTRKALDELLPLQRDDFYGVFKAMHGEAVTSARSIHRSTSFSRSARS
jgi:pyruvate,orthophosphate dikinase